MKSRRIVTPLFKLLVASLIFAIALVLLFKGASGPMNAQQSPSAQQERQIENRIPKQVPISVKITKEKEKAWKDLKNENWARDFEIEITNTGDKPIYALGLRLYFDVPNEYQDYEDTDIAYGRPEINHVPSKATADDVPIKPGESKIFTIHPNTLLSWEKGRREKGYRLPTKVTIKLQLVNFGDGTGLLYDQGVPYPKHPPETSRFDNHTPQLRRAKPRAQKNHTTLPAVLPVSYLGQIQQRLLVMLPRLFMSVNRAAPQLPPIFTSCVTVVPRVGIFGIPMIRHCLAG